MDKYKSIYSGQEIDNLLTKTNSITPNPTTEGTEDLEKITIGGTTYNLGGSDGGVIEEVTELPTPSEDAPRFVYFNGAVYALVNKTDVV